MRRLPAALLAAGAVVALASPGASQPGGPPGAAQTPRIAQIIDVPPGGGGQPVKALHPDGVTVGRYHLTVDPAIDAPAWRLELATERWAPEEVRIQLGFDESGVPTTRLQSGDGDDDLGTAAAVLEPDGVALDVPGIPGGDATLRLLASTGEGEAANTLVLNPVLVADLAEAPADGLRSPVEAVLYGAGGMPSEKPVTAPAGPALRRTASGVRITLPDPIPTTANGLSVTAVTDRVLLRATDDLFAPIVGSLVITADGVTLLDGVGAQLPSEDNPWRVPFESAGGATPVADVSFTEVGDLLDTPLGGAARVGLLRVLDLDDGTRLIADGIDVRVDALPQTATAEDDETPAVRRRTDDDSPAAWRTILPVAVGLLLVIVVLAPSVWFRVQGRRARRARDHAPR